MFKSITLEHDSYSKCISINNQRYEYLCKNFNAVGLDLPRLYKSVRWSRGSNTGCVIGHISLLNISRCFDYPYVIVYEDDAYPRTDVIKTWNYVKQYIPDDCGILKLGTSSFRGEQRQINECICQMMSGSAFGSHAYIVRNELFDTLINTMILVNLPDAAMDLKYYKDEKFKPYCLNTKYQLFIQKNVDIDNIISNKGGQMFWYPHPSKPCGCTSGLPPKHFKRFLLSPKEEKKYVKNLVVVFNKKWKKGKKTAIFNGDRIYTKEESGIVRQQNPNIYMITWENPDGENKRSLMVYNETKNGIKFYTIKGDYK